MAAFGSGSDSVLALAALHSFSSFPSSAHVCAVSEKPPSSETPEDTRQIDQRECKLLNEKMTALDIPKTDMNALPVALREGLHTGQIQTALFHFDKSL